MRGSFDSTNWTQASKEILPSNTETEATLRGMPSRSRWRKTVSPQERRSPCLSLCSWLDIAALLFSCRTSFGELQLPESLISVHERKARPELHQLEHFVDTDVDAAQNDFDAFVVSSARELFQRSERARIDPAHGRKIQSHFTLDAVQFFTGLLQRLDSALFIDLQPHGNRCHTHHHPLRVLSLRCFLLRQPSHLRLAAPVIRLPQQLGQFAHERHTRVRPPGGIVKGKLGQIWHCP